MRPPGQTHNKKNKTLPVAMRSAEPLDIVATHIMPLETIYVCRVRGSGIMSVSANRLSPSRVLIACITFSRSSASQPKKMREEAGRLAATLALRLTR